MRAARCRRLIIVFSTVFSALAVSPAVGNTLASFKGRVTRLVLAHDSGRTTLTFQMSYYGTSRDVHLVVPLPPGAGGAELDETEALDRLDAFTTAGSQSCQGALGATRRPAGRPAEGEFALTHSEGVASLVGRLKSAPSGRPVLLRPIRFSFDSSDFSLPAGLFPSEKMEAVVIALARKGKVEAASPLQLKLDRASSVDWCNGCAGPPLPDSELKRLGAHWLDEPPVAPQKPVKMIWPPPPDAPVRAFLTRLRGTGNALSAGFTLRETADTRPVPEKAPEPCH